MSHHTRNPNHTRTPRMHWLAWIIVVLALIEGG